MNKINICGCATQQKIYIFTTAKTNDSILTQIFYDDWPFERTRP